MLVFAKSVDNLISLGILFTMKSCAFRHFDVIGEGMHYIAGSI